MRKRAPSEPERPSQRGGPPPLRRPEPARAVKPKRRATLKEIRHALWHKFSVGTLRKDLSHFLVYGLFGFVFIFAAGAFFSFGDAAMRSARGGGVDEPGPVMAKIGGEALMRDKFEDQLRSFGMMRAEMATYRFQQIGQMFDRWVDDQLLARAAAKRGVSVSGKDLDEEVKKRVDEALKAERGELSERDWKYRLQQQGKSAADVETDMRDKVLQDKAAIESYLLQEKLRKNVEAEVKLTPEDLKEKYDTITGREILVRIDAYKPPPGPEDPSTEKPEDAKRRQEQMAEWEKALAAKKPEAEKILAEVKAKPAGFADLAKAKSSDYNADQGGKFGPASRSDYDVSRFGKEFAEAAFKLKPGEISGLIKGDNGWVIVQVDSRQTWPDDFKKADPRTMDEAKKLADQVHAKLAAGGDFAALAKQYSDDPGSKDKGGEYDFTERGVWVRPFEKMAFRLKKDELSKPFRTTFGWHIMQCLDRELPKAGETAPPEPDDKDVDEETQKQVAEMTLPDHQDLPAAKRIKVRHILIKGQDPQQQLKEKEDQLLSERQSKHYQEFTDKLRKDAFDSGLVRILDPELLAYKASKDGHQDEQMFWLQRAARGWPNSHPEVHYELGRLYEQRAGFAAPGDQKIAAATALASYPADEVAGGLVKALDGAAADVRKAVINSLGALKAEQAAGKLQEIVRSDPDDSVAEAAKQALQKMGQTVPERKPAKPLPAPESLGITPTP